MVREFRVFYGVETSANRANRTERGLRGIANRYPKIDSIRAFSSKVLTVNGLNGWRVAHEKSRLLSANGFVFNSR